MFTQLMFNDDHSNDLLYALKVIQDLCREYILNINLDAICRLFTNVDKRFDKWDLTAKLPFPHVIQKKGFANGQFYKEKISQYEHDCKPADY